MHCFIVAFFEIVFKNENFSQKYIIILAIVKDTDYASGFLSSPLLDQLSPQLEESLGPLSVALLRVGKPARVAESLFVHLQLKMLVINLL